MIPEIQLVSRYAEKLPSVPWPGAATLCTPWIVAPWLSQHADRLGSGGPVHRVAAVGTLAPHWRPQNAGDRAFAMRAIRSGGSTLQGSLGSWLRGLSGWRLLDAAIIARVVPHLDQVEALTELACGSGAAALLTALVQERDDLQSLLTVLRLANRPGVDAMAASLQVADRCWSAQLSIVGEYMDPASLEDLLRSVARKEPDLWWGAL